MLLALFSHYNNFHQCGTAPVDSDDYIFEILPHVLRMQMSRRPCKDPTDPNCKDGRPPIADYPKYSSVITPYSDLLHWDVKIPSEHTIEGEIFDGEIQMFHTHYGGRVSSIGIPIRATEDGYNPDMQDIIDQFQLVYDEHEFNCLNGGRRHLFYNDKQQRRAREMLRDLVYAKNTTTTVTTEETLKTRKRQLQSMKFDPYSESFMRDIFFYRYDGSITEPPCLTITWWVMMHPAIISFEQLFQLKMLLFKILSIILVGAIFAVGEISALEFFCWVRFFQFPFSSKLWVVK